MAFLKRLYLRFLGAVQFLTVVPIERSTAPIHESAPFFPLVGVLVGIVGALPLAWFSLPAGLGAALCLLIQLALTGMLHEDGLADIADGVRKGRARDKIFEIIKDSRIGVYGASALFVALLLRWQGLASIGATVRSPWEVMGMVAISEGLSRSTLICLSWIAPAAKPGMGSELSASRNRWALFATFLQAGVMLALAGWVAGLVLLGGLTLIVWIARQYFIARLGGLVGDCFGALQQACVIYCLVAFTWAKSF